MAQTHKLGTVATSVRTEDGTTTIRYHQTDVVKFNKVEGWIQLDSGGWHTVTTKLRMNQAANQFGLGYSVYQRKGEWFVDTPDGRTLDFADGMKVAL